MTDNRDLETLERGAYRGSSSDGIIDIFVGVSLLWIGAAWIWLPDLAGIAGILPAVFVAPVLAARRSFVESRGGYVKWSEPRRRWERRNLAALLTAGVVVFLIGVAAFLVVSESSADNDIVSTLMPGLIAWLLALLATGLAFLMGTWRMLVYAGVLAAGGILTASAEANPGWPLLPAGIVIAATGLAMLVRFIRHNPVVATP